MRNYSTAFPFPPFPLFPLFFFSLGVVMRLAQLQVAVIVIGECTSPLMFLFSVGFGFASTKRGRCCPSPPLRHLQSVPSQ